MIEVLEVEVPDLKIQISEDVEMIVLGSRDEWLKHRTGIGGSDAAAIIGLNPYKTNQELWAEKTGRMIPEDISYKPYVQYGITAEPYLRELYQLDHPDMKVEYRENNMFLNKKYPFAHASLDGWLTDPDGRKGILEIKTTNILQSMQKEKWNDRIPDNYYTQCLWYLGVTEFEFVELKAQIKYDFDDLFFQTKHYHIERSDVEDDISFLFRKAKEFYKNITDDKKPALILPEI